VTVKEERSANDLHPRSSLKFADRQSNPLTMNSDFAQSSEFWIAEGFDEFQVNLATAN
jgi:hypothetical protein